METWPLVGIGIIAAGAAAVLFGRRRERLSTEQAEHALLASASRPSNTAVDFDLLGELPTPVARYFRHVLGDGQRLIHAARMRQSGVLRTSTTAAGWSSFTARQLVVPPAMGFVWDARVALPLATHLRVRDSYVAGMGSGKVSALSAFAVAAEAGVPELNAGALHRYLAEAVWYPTALLPQSGVAWSPIDDRAALATLTNRGTTVSLEFRFNEMGEATGIYSPGRFGRFHGAYKQVPWEGHFRDYRSWSGMRVPRYGEVGWHEGGSLQLVWKGNVFEALYDFEPQANGALVR